MAFVKVVSPVSKAKKSAVPAVSPQMVSRPAAFKKVCKDFDNASELSKAGLEELTRFVTSLEMGTFIEIGGSAAALYVAFHTEYAHIIGFESSEARYAQIGQWHHKLVKFFPGICTHRLLDPTYSALSSLKSKLTKSTVVFVNTAHLGMPAFIEMLPSIEANFKQGSVLIVTSNPWPRPSKLHPAPFKLFDIIDMELGSNVGSGQLTLFCFQHLNGTRPSTLSVSQIQPASRQRVIPDYVITHASPSSSANSRQTGGSAKKSASAASRVSAAQLSDLEMDDLPPAKPKTKRGRTEDAEEDPETQPKSAKKPTIKSPPKAKASGRKSKPVEEEPETHKSVEEDEVHTPSKLKKRPILSPKKSATPAGKFNSPPPPKAKITSPTKKSAAATTTTPKPKATRAKAASSTAASPKPRKAPKAKDLDESFVPSTDASVAESEMQVDEVPEVPAPVEVAQPQTWGSWLGGFFGWGN